MSLRMHGWPAVRLKDVCELLNGRAYKQAELLKAGKYPVLRVGNFFSNKNWYFSNLELQPDKYCNNGDLLYAWSASFGPKIWDGGRVIYHYHIWRTRPNEQLVNKRFLYHWLNWDKENIKAEHGTGSTMIHVTKGDMENRHLYLPPLLEQQRIVAKIDSLSAKSERARDQLDRVVRLVKKYKQAVLSAAFRGDLTAGWRATTACNGSWGETSLGAVIADMRYGTAKKCRYGGGPISVLRIPNVQQGSITLDDIKSAEFSREEVETLRLEDGDILVIRSNGSLDLVGRSAIVREQAKGMLFAGYLIRLRMNCALANPEFIQYWLQAPETRETIESLAKSTSGVNNINSTQLRDLKLQRPSLAEQSEIVRRIEMSFTRIDRLEAEARSARKLVDHLEKTVLTKAFAGELMPRDHQSGEPAIRVLTQTAATTNAA